MYAFVNKKNLWLNKSTSDSRYSDEITVIKQIKTVYAVSNKKTVCSHLYKWFVLSNESSAAW